MKLFYTTATLPLAFLHTAFVLALPAWLPFQGHAIEPSYNLYERLPHDHYNYVGTDPQPTVPSPTPTTTKAPTCHHDNFLRQFLGKPTLAAEFCATFTVTPISETTALPIYVSGYNGDRKRISSACECLGILVPATSTSASSETSTLDGISTASLAFYPTGTEIGTGYGTAVTSSSSTEDSFPTIRRYPTLYPTIYPTFCPTRTGYPTLYPAGYPVFFPTRIGYPTYYPTTYPTTYSTSHPKTTTLNSTTTIYTTVTVSPTLPPYPVSNTTTTIDSTGFPTYAAGVGANPSETIDVGGIITSILDGGYEYTPAPYPTFNETATGGVYPSK